MPFSVIRHARDRARLIAVALALAASPVAWLGLPATDSGAQAPEAPATVTVTPSAGLVDGQRIEVTITPNRPEVRVSDGAIRICRDGETYEYTGTPLDNIPDLQDRAGKCLPIVTPLSTLGSEGGAYRTYAFPDGTSRGEFSMGVGAAQWPADAGTASLTCDATHPCRLVVPYAYVEGGVSRIVVDSSTLLTFADEQQISLGGCAGIADGAPRSVGTSRLADLWVAWTRERCRAAGPGTLAETASVLGDERGGLEAFASGDADLVYSSVGYPFGPGSDTQPPGRLYTPPTRRPYIATPVALNAPVIAVFGGHPTLTPDVWPALVPQPFTDLRLTIDEAAALFGQGPFGIDWTPVRGRNVELDALGSFCCTFFDKVTQVPSGIDSRSLFMTTFFDALAPESWREFIPLGGAFRGIVPNFSDASPPFTGNTVNGYSSRALLGKAVFSIEGKELAGRFNAMWTLTDYASAVALGMTPVAIQFEEGGEFVLPTPETIAAGAAGLVPQPDGTLSPDPGSLPPGAYPLTMVEYALAPADPLPAEKCTTGPLLASWLRYVTSDTGQGLVADQHMVPLTGSLRSGAEEAVARVAAVPVPTCPGVTPPGGTVPPGTTSTTPGPAAATTPTGSTGSSSSRSGSGSAGSGSAVVTPDADSQAQAEAIAESAEIEMPPFLGVKALNDVAPPVALLLVVILTSGAALVTSGRRLPPAVAAVPGRVMGRLPRPRRPGRGGGGG